MGQVPNNIGSYSINRYFLAQDKNSVKSNARESRISVYMRKNKNLIEMKESDAWATNKQRGITRLTIVLLHYLFTNDDGSLSRYEIKVSKKYIHEHEIYLDDNDVKYFASMAIPYDKSQLISYLQENKMTKEIFLETVKSVKLIIKKNYVYRNALNQLRDELYPTQL